MGTQDVESGRLADSVLNCIESLCARNDMEYRRVRRALRKAEGVKMQEGTETNRPAEEQAGQPQNMQLPQQIVAQLDALNRKLAAANLEIRRYETRVFAYERAVYALRQENAELTELCKQARQGKPLPPEPQPQEPVLDKPGLPVIHFTPQGEQLADAGQLDAEEEPFFDEGRPPRPGTKTKPKPLLEPRTPLEHLSVQLLAQFDGMMGT